MLLHEKCMRARKWCNNEFNTSPFFLSLSLLAAWASATAAAATFLFDFLRRTLHSGEADEDLFEGRLTDRVVFDVEVDLGALDLTEHVRPRQLLDWRLSTVE